jgi:hypothetical protein
MKWLIDEIDKKAAEIKEITSVLDRHLSEAKELTPLYTQLGRVAYIQFKSSIDAYDLRNLVSTLGTTEEELREFCTVKSFNRVAKRLMDYSSGVTDFDNLMETLIKFYRSCHV